MTEFSIDVTRTWCGRTRARLTGRAWGVTIDVEVTGWRRASVLAEAQATFEAVAADPTHPLPQPKWNRMLRALLLLLVALVLLVGLPASTPVRHAFADSAPLDTSQVIDMRDLYGELICRPGDAVPADCEIDYHPTTVHIRQGIR
ncbi:hypothetical protein GCM10027258_62630 [Amycolatopsis stemonae]